MKFPIHSTASIVLLTAAAISFSTPQKVEAKQWNMCAWEEIPHNVVKRIARRSDYADILGHMFENCPESALMLTEAATAATRGNSVDTERKGEPRSDSGRVRSVPSGNAGSEAQGGGNNGGGNGGGGNNGGGH
jgi:uncharacterized membrane protein YgcG